MLGLRRLRHMRKKKSAVRNVSTLLELGTNSIQHRTIPESPFTGARPQLHLHACSFSENEKFDSLRRLLHNLLRHAEYHQYHFIVLSNSNKVFAAACSSYRMNLEDRFDQCTFRLHARANTDGSYEVQLWIPNHTCNIATRLLHSSDSHELTQKLVKHHFGQDDVFPTDTMVRSFRIRCSPSAETAHEPQK